MPPLLLFFDQLLLLRKRPTLLSHELLALRLLSLEKRLALLFSLFCFFLDACSLLLELATVGFLGGLELRLKSASGLLGLALLLCLGCRHLRVAPLVVPLHLLESHLRLPHLLFFDQLLLLRKLLTLLLHKPHALRLLSLEKRLARLLPLP